MSFPVSPIDNQEYVTPLGTVYKYVLADSRWILSSATLTGATGIQGTTGVRGLTGIKGETGLQGFTGPAGAPQGVTGLQGIKGATGIQGVTGLIGSTGFQGTTGVQGSVYKFSAYVSSSLVTGVTGDGTTYQILYDAKLFDIGSCFNTSTGIFTCPATGYYRFETTVTASHFTSAHDYMIVVLQVAGKYYVNAKLLTDNSNFDSATSMSLTAYMQTSDIATVSIEVRGGTKVVNVLGHAGDGYYTTFTGSSV